MVRKYTAEVQQKTANKYITRNEMKENEDLIYQSIVRDGKLDETFGSHPNQGFPIGKAQKGYWNEATIKDAISECTTRTEFQKKYAGAYDALNALHNLGLLNKYQLLELLNRVGNKYKRKVYVVISEALGMAYVGLTYDPLKRKNAHFRQEHKASSEIVANGDAKFIELTDFTSCDEAINLEAFYIQDFKEQGYVVTNVAPAGGLGGSEGYSFDEIQAVANEFKWIADFAREESGYASVAYKRGWMDDLFKDHKNKGLKRSSKGRTFEECQAAADACITRAEFEDKFTAHYSRAHKKGWMKTLFAEHANEGYVGKVRPGTVLDKAYCLEKASKYRDSSDFNRNHPGAYKICCRKAWLTECNFERKQPKQREPKYSDEEIIQQVVKCSTYKELLAKNSKIYWYIYGKKRQSEFRKYLMHK